MPALRSVNSSPRLIRCRGQRRLRRARQANQECASVFPGILPAENLSAMRSHNSIADAQSQSRPFAHLLGGKERIEDALGVADARSVIHKRHLDGIARAPCCDADPPVISGLLDGIVRI